MTQVGRPLPSTTGADPILDDLIEAFAAKLQAGEHIDPEAYAQEHPERGEELRRILPAMLVLADLAQSSGHLLPTGNSRGDDSDTALGELGDFRILREIGRGGMGVVYEAEQISLGRRVALKVLPFAAALDSKQLQRFKNEAQAAAHLHHTNIVPVHAVGCERGVHFYAMQFIEGQTLAQVIQELRELAGHGVAAAACISRPEGASGRETRAAAGAATVPRPGRRRRCHSTNAPAFFRTVAQLGVQAAEALEHAHQLGIVHRDIKPANLLVDMRGQLWITDFGLAHCQSQAGLTMSGDLVGTLRYMSPEQAMGKRGLLGPPHRCLLAGCDALRSAHAGAGLQRPRSRGAVAANRLRGAALAPAAEQGRSPGAGNHRPEGDGKVPGGALRHGPGAGRRSAAFLGR